MTPQHLPADEIKVVLPFAGGTITLLVSHTVASFEVQDQKGKHAHNFWITSQELSSGRPLTPE